MLHLTEVGEGAEADRAALTYKYEVVENAGVD